MDQRAIFLEAIEKTDPTEREAFLAQVCGTDSELRREVESLLVAHARADGFLEPPADALGFRRPRSRS